MSVSFCLSACNAFSRWAHLTFNVYRVSNSDPAWPLGIFPSLSAALVIYSFDKKGLVFVNYGIANSGFVLLILVYIYMSL